MFILAIISIVVILIINIMRTALASAYCSRKCNYAGADALCAGDRPRMLYGGNSTRSDNKTYVIYGNLGGMPINLLEREIESHGFRKATAREISGGKVLLVWTSQDERGYFVKSSYAIKSDIKNVLDNTTYSNIENKRDLHEVMKKQDSAVFNRHFAQSWKLSKFKYPRCDESKKCPVFILRPAMIRYYSGKAILRITSAQELEKAKKYYREKERIELENVLVSEYFDEPYLFDGRKFHLRMYFLVCLAPKGLRWSLWGYDDVQGDDDARSMSAPRGKILTAAKPYVRDSYSDVEIHDTHAHSTPGAFFFPTHAARISEPEDLQERSAPLNIRDIYEQMHIICKSLAARLVEQGIRPYPESARAFDIFGLDFMIVRNPDMRVVLLEVNDRVGYDTPESPLTDIFRRDYFAWAWKEGVAPLLENV